MDVIGYSWLCLSHKKYLSNGSDSLITLNRIEIFVIISKAQENYMQSYSVQIKQSKYRIKLLFYV